MTPDALVALTFTVAGASLAVMAGDRCFWPGRDARTSIGKGHTTLLSRACSAGALASLVVVGIICLGVMLAPRPAPLLILRAARPSPTVDPAPSPVARLMPPPVAASPRRGRIVGAGPEEVNLRAEPSARSARLKGLSDGTELELLGQAAEANGRTWQYVHDPTDGTEGWVAAEFLGPSR